MKKKNAAGCFGRGAFYKYLAAMRIQRVKKKKRCFKRGRF